MMKKFLLLLALWVTVFDMSAQPKPAVPDTVLLRRPFSAQDRISFMQPDRIFYPETWFHFLNGSVDKKGITKDLEAIASAGIAGVQFFHGQLGNSADFPGTEEHIECLSPKWESLVQHTAREAKRLGLRFTMQTCPGWAMSGGPWITPDKAMRHLTFSRIYVEGGKLVKTQLSKTHSEDWRDYRDVKVLAFPTPEGDTGTHLIPSSVTASAHEEMWGECVKGTLSGSFVLEPTNAQTPYVVEAVFPEGTMVRTLEFNPIDRFNHDFCVDPDIHVCVTALKGEDGTVVLDANMPYANWQDNEMTMSFALDECPGANRYRVEIVNGHRMEVSRMRFYSAARKNNWEGEAGWTSRSILRENEHPRQSANCYVRYADILDLTDKMDAEGNLQWDAPEGRWTILRIGHVNTGRRNGPAPAEATGWEVNKFDAECVDFQFNSYVGRLNATSLKGLVDNMLMDSWECSSQTWTGRMPEEFRRFTGYELANWIPALFGYVIDDQEQTGRFLCDWRLTQNDLFVNNFYGRMVDNAHKAGLTASYETAAGDIFPADPMEFYKFADVPMCEFWQPFHNFLANHNYKPIRPCASAARMYGKPRVSAEAFTSFELTWDEHLSMLREVANQNLVEGVSHLVFHSYTNNPDADKYFPGTSFGGNIGTPFLRKQTWWQHMPAFTTYLARCSYMLERGLPVSSVLWFIGDETQQKPDQLAEFVPGYAFDYCNTDALLHRLEICDGKWMTPEGITYDVLYIPSSERMLPQTAERLLELVRQGGNVIGDAPRYSATLCDSSHLQQRFINSVSALWNGDTGKGRVLGSMSLEQGLRTLHIPADVCPLPTSIRGERESLRWLHRKTEGADWYFVCPEQEKDFMGTVDFHCTGAVEIWNPMTGHSEQIPATQHDGRTSVGLCLHRGECVFVSFIHDKKTKADYVRAKMKNGSWANLEVPGGLQWTLTFPEGWGIGEPLQLADLKPWKDLDISAEGKAFSGTATYQTTFTLGKKNKKARYTLDLGKVEEIAVVKLNGKEIQTLWAEPYQCDITDALRAGKNELTIEVTSTWYNRLAYDASLQETERRTWVIHGPRAGSPLRDSGLLGPVFIWVE